MYYFVKMKFNTTVMCQTIVFTILLSYSVGGCVADGVEHIDNTWYKEENDAVISLANIANSIITWKTLISPQYLTLVLPQDLTQVPSKDPIQVPSDSDNKTPGQSVDTSQVLSQKATQEKEPDSAGDRVISIQGQSVIDEGTIGITDNLKTLNDIMYDLQCTYAYFAKLYVEFILQNVMVDKIETLKPLLHLKSALIATSTKAKYTFINFGFHPPDWLTAFLTYLRGQDETPIFTIGLEGIANVLIEATNESQCNYTEVYNTLLYLPDYMHWVLWESCSEYIDILTELKHEDGLALSLYWLGMNFLLHRNRSVLSYENTPATSWFLYSYSLISIEKPYSVTDINDNHTFYAAELREIDKYLTRGYQMLELSIWNSPITPDVLEYVTEKPPKVFDVEYYRSRYIVFKNVLREILYAVHCVYAHYAAIHIRETFDIFFKLNPDVREKNRKENVALALKYLEIAHMQLATYYNENRHPPKWLMFLVFYLNKLSVLYQDPSSFAVETKEVQRYIDEICMYCGNIAFPKTFYVPLREIQENYTQGQTKLFIRLQQEMIAIQLTDPERGRYVSGTYQNLIQIAYFLYTNSANLQHSNYQEFHVSKWLIFERMEITTDLLNTLRWDVLELDRENSAWDQSVTTLMENIQKYNIESQNGGMIRLINSKKINHAFSAFIMAAVIRLSTSFLIRCKNIRSSNVYRNSEHGDSFVDHCTGIAAPVTRICNMTALNDYDHFFVKLSAELEDYENQVRDEEKDHQLNTKKIDKLILKNIVKLQPISINWKLKANNLIQSISIQELTLWKPVKDIKQAIENFETNYKEKFKTMVDYIRIHNALVNAVDVDWPYSMQEFNFKIV
ncbi:Hypothetical protein CINCED_3A025922 [Cinara cedri]|uniref:Uncharacterized protein n=1 Tax=Cinara cedri TaxID=506608 RepID=A0A5E4NT02_9HEMI|nr:Hypothetical protein CINCED_3A025922 [Cinara cedri]